MLWELFQGEAEISSFGDDKTSVESVKLGKTSDVSENLSWKPSTPF